MEAISQNQDQVMIEAVHIKSGERKVYHAQYAVGCDGGKSFVRKSLGKKTWSSNHFKLPVGKHYFCSVFTGIHLKGEFDLSKMKSISFESLELKDRIAIDEQLGIMTVKSNVLGFTLPLNKEGLFVTHIFSYKEDLKPEEYLKILFDDKDIPYKVVFANDWQGHFASAETLQQGRVFLAGNIMQR